MHPIICICMVLKFEETITNPILLKRIIENVINEHAINLEFTKKIKYEMFVYNRHTKNITEYKRIPVHLF